jgi:hypothetical protein
MVPVLWVLVFSISRSSPLWKPSVHPCGGFSSGFWPELRTLLSPLDLYVRYTHRNVRICHAKHDLRGSQPVRVIL